jgi:hypothetical protein
MDRKEETKIVKNALKQAGIKASVGHGAGTAWGWLEIRIEKLTEWGEHIINPETNDHRDCPYCKRRHAIGQQALQIALQVTGRHASYDGRISIG